MWSLFFFFQAEDGIRDLTVTGVQTCALPISGRGERERLPSDSVAAERGMLCHGGWSVEFLCLVADEGGEAATCHRADSKSTRLNSSHSQISYALFCLEKKNSVVV